MNIMNLINAMPGAVAQGLIWGIMAIGVYITFRVLDIADLTVDGTLCTGGAVCIMMMQSGQVAYEPLLASPHRNLRSLGLCIVRQFGIEEAEEALLRIAASDAVPEIGCEAVRTLCALQQTLDRKSVV